MKWYRVSGAEMTIQVHAQPRAKRTGVAGLHGDCIRIRLASAPADAKADACLIAFPSARFEVRRNQVQITQGLAARRKTVRVHGSALDPEALLEPGQGLAES